MAVKKNKGATSKIKDEDVVLKSSDLKNIHEKAGRVYMALQSLMLDIMLLSAKGGTKETLEKLKSVEGLIMKEINTKKG